MQKSVLIDIIHPANVHFFKPIISDLRQNGFRIVICSRKKDCTTELLDGFQLDHHVLSEQSGGWLGLVKEYILRSFRLFIIIRDLKPDFVIGKESACLSLAARLNFKKATIFDDTDDARLQRFLIKLGLCHFVDFKTNAIYAPAHYIQQNMQSNPHSGTLLRLIAGRASHDYGLKILTDVEVVSILKELSGEVVISSERVLPSHLESQRFKGSSLELHGDLARKKQLITESPTMAVEALFLGVPRIIYLSRRVPWYIQVLAGAYPHLLLVGDYKNLQWALRAEVDAPDFEKLHLEKLRSQRLVRVKLEEIGLSYA